MKNMASVRIAFWIIFGIACVVLLTEIAGTPSNNLQNYGALPEFTLTNQLGQPVSLADLKGRVWVADMIYTRCPSQCVRLTYQMSRLQAALAPNGGVKLLSITTDPDFDTPGILNNYAHRNNASENWIFLTGQKEMIRRLAIDGMKLAVSETTPDSRDNPDDLFIHSTKFVLIDKLGRIRGYYCGDTPDAQPEILAAIHRLNSER